MAKTEIRRKGEAEEATALTSLIRVKKVYALRNGEREGEWPEELCEEESVLAWEGERFETGFFRYELFRSRIGGRMHLLKTWIPTFGYSWDEEVVYELEPIDFKGWEW